MLNDPLSMIDPSCSGLMKPNTNIGAKMPSPEKCSMKKQRRTFSPEFKQETASLVLDQGYSVAMLIVGVFVDYNR